MKIDWKRLAQSPGYKSLKAAYAHDLQKKYRSKQELRKLFRRVIDLAKHYAIRRNTTVEQVLNAWEAKRDHWWLNFYSNFHRGKLPSGKPRNVQPEKPETYYLTTRWYSGKERFQRLREDRQRRAKGARKAAGKKPRWDPERKRWNAERRARQQSL